MLSLLAGLEQHHLDALLRQLVAQRAAAGTGADDHHDAVVVEFEVVAIVRPPSTQERRRAGLVVGLVGPARRPGSRGTGSRRPATSCPGSRTAATGSGCCRAPPRCGRARSGRTASLVHALQDLGLVALRRAAGTGTCFAWSRAATPFLTSSTSSGVGLGLLVQRLDHLGIVDVADAVVRVELPRHRQQHLGLVRAEHRSSVIAQARLLARMVAPPAPAITAAAAVAAELQELAAGRGCACSFAASLSAVAAVPLQDLDLVAVGVLDEEEARHQAAVAVELLDRLRADPGVGQARVSGRRDRRRRTATWP